MLSVSTEVSMALPEKGRHSTSFQEMSLGKWLNCQRGNTQHHNSISFKIIMEKDETGLQDNVLILGKRMLLASDRNFQKLLGRGSLQGKERLAYKSLWSVLSW